jgi:hypothetical protein
MVSAAFNPFASVPLSADTSAADIGVSELQTPTTRKSVLLSDKACTVEAAAGFHWQDCTCPQLQSLKDICHLWCNQGLLTYLSSRLQRAPQGCDQLDRHTVGRLCLAA